MSRKRYQQPNHFCQCSQLQKRIRELESGSKLTIDQVRGWLEGSGLNIVSDEYVSAINKSWAVSCDQYNREIYLSTIEDKLKKREERLLLPQPNQQSPSPLTGWRSWDYRNGHLFSRVTWPHRAKLEAEHRDGYDEGGGVYKAGLREQSRGHGNEAGIHAARSLDELLVEYKNVVIGEVYLWGWVKEYEKGYRAQFAYPKSLYVHPDTDIYKILILEEGYGVPVEHDSRCLSPVVTSEGYGFPAFKQVTATQAMITMGYWYSSPLVKWSAPSVVEDKP